MAEDQNKRRAAERLEATRRGGAWYAAVTEGNHVLAMTLGAAAQRLLQPQVSTVCSVGGRGWIECTV